MLRIVAVFCCFFCFDCSKFKKCSLTELSTVEWNTFNTASVSTLLYASQLLVLGFYATLRAFSPSFSKIFPSFHFPKNVIMICFLVRRRNSDEKWQN